MKMAVSIPDPLFEEAERLARRLGKSRSQLFSEAMSEYLSRQAPEAMKESLLAGEDEVEPSSSSAARRLLDRIDW